MTRTHRRLWPLLCVLAILGSACATLGELTPAGRFDVAMESATGVVEELTTQALYVRDARFTGKLDAYEAVRRFEALNTAQEALLVAIGIANAAFEAGDDPDLLVVDLNDAIGDARAVIRREGNL